MTAVAVRITRYIDDSQPGWVECELVDALGRRHALVDKAPVFSSAPLGSCSHYPQPGTAACEVIERGTDAVGRPIARVTTARPFGIESVEGISEFVVLAEQLVGPE